MYIPLELSLKNEKQVSLARLQDIAVEVLFNIEPSVIMHGGTAIWRCYNGNRFSEDIDIYATDKQVKHLSNELVWLLSKKGVKLDYPEFISRVLTFSDEFASSKIEIMKLEENIEPIQKEYIRANGTKFVITTLSIRNFILEKIKTYKKREYIRDFYDIYHLVNIEIPDIKVKETLREFINDIGAPINNKVLGELIYAGAIPTFKTMINSIKGVLG